MVASLARESSKALLSVSPTTLSLRPNWGWGTEATFRLQNLGACPGSCGQEAPTGVPRLDQMLRVRPPRSQPLSGRQRVGGLLQRPDGLGHLGKGHALVMPTLPCGK